MHWYIKLHVEYQGPYTTKQLIRLKIAGSLKPDSLLVKSIEESSQVLTARSVLRENLTCPQCYHATTSFQTIGKPHTCVARCGSCQSSFQIGNARGFKRAVPQPVKSNTVTPDWFLLLDCGRIKAFGPFTLAELSIESVYRSVLPSDFLYCITNQTLFLAANSKVFEDAFVRSNHSSRELASSLLEKESRIPPTLFSQLKIRGFAHMPVLRGQLVKLLEGKNCAWLDKTIPSHASGKQRSSAFVLKRIHVGPRGGKFVYNLNGNKYYATRLRKLRS